MARKKLRNRRVILGLLAGGAVWAVGMRSSQAGERRIERLIHAARGMPLISQRIAFISSALRGSPYIAHTLIGGPCRLERFVARDDGFDCVTYVETVLAAAMARSPDDFDNALRKIRYCNGIVSWRARNNYFFEWGEHNVANHICWPIVMPGAVEVDKIVDWHKALGKRHFSMTVIPHATFLAHRHMLMDGDIIGFVTHRPNLDYFHVGFIMFGRRGELLLRNAARSYRRVLDENMHRFLAVNRVRYVTLLRPHDQGLMI